MLGALNTIEIEELLKSQTIGRIGCHANDTTYIVPVSYAYDGEYVYAHSRDGMKINMMRQNPEVCFEVEEIVNMANWESVIAWGEFEELTNEEERNKAMELLIKQLMPFIVSETVLPSHGLGTMKVAVVYRIRLSKKVGRFEKQG
ncbi:pyridoxamine 5'-phosphate oxidase family protein [Solitalea lacus]|uniref:pyridoxamine 5'-phosphate oxidase family protein n=1 Tax=Solitalea lacus TaxID=2911172 RepID=UPI001EDA9ECE|nr:pyridoxamine 5'-phosphate oxidase family protein [Solitalea lacus]UKJ06352.1 pyridoxamine 5'-phosphate oxidase family protein [Solitalea lacus]